jgi:hypothetical protein
MQDTAIMDVRAFIFVGVWLRIFMEITEKWGTILIERTVVDTGKNQ